MKIVIGISYNKQNNVDKIAIWNSERKAIESLTTLEAKKRYNNRMLKTENASFKFFINSVDFTIGEQSQYPVFTDKGIENGLIIYNTKKTEDNKFQCLLIENNKVKELEVEEEPLKKLKNIGYKCNFTINDKGNIQLTYKKDNNSFTVDYSDNISQIDAIDSGWFKLTNNIMVPYNKCPMTIFTSKTIAGINGFKDSDIEEVDLSGAKIIMRQAFKGCHKLRKVVFSESLTRIDDEAFIDCPNLKELRLPPSLQDLGTRVYSGPVVYMHSPIESAIKPFGTNTKIIMYGKASKTSIIKVAYNENQKQLAYLQIEPKTGEYEKKVINKQDIDDLVDDYINYTNKVGKGEVIICGKSGIDYVYIDKALKLKIANINELKDKKIADGIIVDNEIVPSNKSWKWQYINIKGVKDEHKAGKGVSTHIVHTSDKSHILNEDQSTILSDYIALKCSNDMNIKQTVRSAKFTNKMNQERDKYPGIEWRFLQYSTNENLPKLDNPDFKQDKRGWWSCYFGHPTKIHWLAGGYKGNELQYKFSFGSDCFQGFTGISDGQMKAYLAYEAEFIKMIDEITKVYKTNSYNQYVKNHIKFYEIMEILSKKLKYNLLGKYGEIAYRLYKIKCPIPKLIIKDIINTMPDMEEVIFNIIDSKSLQNLQLVYKFPNLKDLNSNEHFEDIQDSIHKYVKSWSKEVENAV